MGKYKIINLRNETIKYIRGHLANGLTFSRYILSKLDLEVGQITTGLPDNVNLKKLYDLEHGGVLPTPPESKWREVIGEGGKKSTMVPTPRFFSYVVETIDSFLKKGNSRLCIFENANAHPTDPWLQKCQSVFWIHQEEVYHVLNEGKHSVKEIQRTLNEAESLWTFVGFMTSLPSRERSALTKKIITTDILMVLAERTEKIIIGAYDGEGYLIWHRSSS